MAVSLTYASTVTIEETMDVGVPAISVTNKTITHNGYNTSKALNSGTTPPVSKCAVFLQALTAGTATIDLTALPGTNGVTVDLSGLKVQVFKMRASNGNANPITATEGAANGYELAGNTWKAAVSAQQEFTFYGHDATPDVAAGAKNIDLTGTGAQTVEITIVAG